MTKQREMGSVDLETGEILPHVLVAMQQKIPNGFAEGGGGYGTERGRFVCRYQKHR